MRVLVAGGAGYIGSHVVADLKAGGGDVLLVKANGDWWTVNGFLKGDVSK